MKSFSSQSAAVKSGVNFKLPDTVESFVYAGLQKMLLAKFSLKSAWVVSEQDKLRAVSSMFGSNEVAGELQPGAVEYPYGLLTMQSLAEDPERGNLRAMAKRGSIVAVNDTRNGSYNVRFIPAIFRIQLEHVSNDLKVTQDFMSALLHARVGGWLSFNISYGRTSFGVRVFPEGEISVPQRASRGTNSEDFTLQIPIQVRGYAGLPVLTEGEIISGVDVDSQVAATQAAEGTTFWAFRTPNESQTGNESSVSVNHF